MREDVRTISAAKTNMAVVGQDRLGLSPFGMLSQVFNQEIVRRSQLLSGAYQAVPLTFLEEEEQEETSPAPQELHLDVSVNVTVEEPKDRKKEEQPSASKPDAPTERILERVRVLQKELRRSQETTRLLILQTQEGGHRQVLRLPDVPARAGGEDMRAGEGNLPLSGENRRPAGGALVPAARPAGVQVISARPELPLAVAATASPAAGGWTPRQQPLHPGYPPRENARETGPALGSILLPDALRRRRQEILERQERGTALSPEQGEALAWSGRSEPPVSREAADRLIRIVERAVNRTLAENRTRQSGREPVRKETPALERPPKRRMPFGRR